MPDSSEPAVGHRPGRVEVLEAVSALKARYFRLMDQKQWADWSELFTQDAVMDMRGEAAAMARLGMDVGDAAAWLLTGRAALRGAVETALDGVTTVHHGHMPEFSMVSDDEVAAIWAMCDIIRYPPGRPVAGFNGYGHYHDTYVRTPDGWRIARTRLDRLHLDAL